MFYGVRRLNYRILKWNCAGLNKMSVFTQKLNPILGESSWEWQDENYNYQQEIARASFADMLHDTERNQKYFQALKEAVKKMHLAGRKAKVLDIGTGTGLLSMMAVRCGADSIVACEAFLPMAACARQVTSLNGCEGKIKIVPKHSTELIVGDDLEEKANILVTEVFDTELIGEGALRTFTHAHNELLEDDCIVIPNSATIYVEMVESDTAEAWNSFRNVYYKNELLLEVPTVVKNCQGAAAVHDIQLSQFKKFKEIIEPTPVMEFDWSGKRRLEFNRRQFTSVKAKSDGVVRVVFMWWELQMDTENTIVLSCAPYWAHPLKKLNPDLILTQKDIPWRDHWMQAVYYLPNEVRLSKGQEVEIVSCHDEYSWWFHLREDKNVELDHSKPVCECGFHIAHSRTKLGQINDENRRKNYLSFLHKHITTESVVLLISDGFYLGLAASKLGAKKILYLEDNYLSTKVFKEFVKCNNLNNVEVIKNIECLKLHKNVKDVDLIFGQPHFSTTILPWDSFYCAYLIGRIYNLVPGNVLYSPKVASIKAIVVEFNDLQKIRLPLQTCETFNVQPFDDLIMNASNNCDANVEAQPLWEYPCVARSSVQELIEIDLQVIVQSTKLKMHGETTFNRCSDYNAIALWVDWDLDGSGKNVISTGPTTSTIIGEAIEWDMHTRQGVHFLVDNNNRDKVNVEITFIVEDGSIKFAFH